MREAITSAHVLSNGEYSVLLTREGGGASALNGYALTRWQPDPAVENYGWFLYLRDLDNGAFWSVGAAPAPADAEGSLRAARDHVELHTLCDGVAAACTIAIAKDRNAEIRTIRIRNHRSAPCNIELTSFAELALNTLGGDAAHPAFSKLFVETAFDEHRNALVAWRRRRSPDDRSLWVGQRMISAGKLEYETDRARFIGRRRSVRDPLALIATEPLSGTVGAVLDPIFALRTTLSLQPREEVTVELLMCAAESRAALDELLERPRIDQRASNHDPQSLGLPDAWAKTIAFDLASHNWRGTGAIEHTPLPAREDYGAFNEAGTEYIIPVAPDIQPTPQPWTNVIANEQVGCIVSETGAGYTWAANSRENRLTPWSNDAVTDPPGELVFLCDVDSEDLWSVYAAPCEVAHGFGYSRFTRESNGLAQRTTVFVPRTDPVKFVHVAITNSGKKKRKLRFIGYAQLVLGTGAPETRGLVVTERDGNAVFATNPERGEFSGRVAFATVIADNTTATAATGSRASLLRDPRQLDDRFGEHLDPCAAVSVDFTLGPGQTGECVFLLGEAEDKAKAKECLARYRTTSAVRHALDEVSAFWRELLGTVHVTTPVRALDLMFNGWLNYQNLVCRMWARSAFYQSGGAFGFRDQLQDSSALLYSDPRITREQILLHAAHQFVEGDVLHWWHPPLSKGIRTRFADDLLWLPYITLFYMDRTGDWDILNENARYLVGRQLEPGEDEIFIVPEDSGTSGTLYEHCCRAIDRSLTRGAHGLPLMGVGDWNDGMNRVGREGRGESVWLGFFLFEILDDFIPVCEARQDNERVHRYMEYMSGLSEALNEGGWDGAWYRRAYYDNGQPIGSSESDECRIDALAQAWAVISGAAPRERAAQAIAQMEQQLICEKDGIIRLLTPAFDKTPNDPGYIKGYIPGVRENGGQYTHGAIWAVRAVAEMGERERAAVLLEMLSPVSHAEDIHRYRAEPYVIAADVYGVAPHVGRAGWTWYTGSAGWWYRVMLESVLGLKVDAGDDVRFQPCIPRGWPGFTLRYRFPSGTTYVFDVRNTSGPSSTSEGVVEDGAIIVPIVHDGARHEVRIEAGDDVVPRYHSRVDESTAPLLRTTSL